MFYKYEFLLKTSWVMFQWNFHFIEKGKVILGVEADHKNLQGSVNYQFGIGLSVGYYVGMTRYSEQGWVKIWENLAMMGYILGNYILIIYVILFPK